MPRPHAVAAAIAVLLVILAAPPALAQERGGVAGKVTDKKTSHAIPFATVTVVGAQKGGLTDSEGNFLITGVPVGTYEVRAQFLGYAAVSQPGVVVTAGRSVTLNFALQEIVVREEKAIEVNAERRLVEVRQGATIRSVNAAEIRNLPVQTITDVLQQQAGITLDADQLHVRGGRADETVFVVNGVSNRDLVTGQSTAGQLNARSVAEINVATGAYDVRYGNALSGVVEVKLKEGGDHFEAGLTTTSGSYGGRSVQFVVGGPSPFLSTMGIQALGKFSSLVDISGTVFATRFPNIDDLPGGPRLRSSYEDGLFGTRFRYGRWAAPTEDNRWAARYALTWKPNDRDKLNFNFSKRIAIDQG